MFDKCGKEAPGDAFTAWPQLWGSCPTVVIPVCYTAGQGPLVLSEHRARGAAASASEQYSALSSRFSCSYTILVLAFIFGGFLGRFHKQMFQPGLKHPLVMREEILSWSNFPLRNCLFFKGRCLLFHNYLPLFFLSEWPQLCFS